MKIKILFVCHGNICRSPSAEAVMTQFVKNADLSDKIECDSAGIIGFHAGEQADRRMQKHAQERGYDLTSISRQIKRQDFANFDYIIGMDDSNMQGIRSIMPQNSNANIFKMTDFCTEQNYNSVPDPYYGGAKGFELVLDLLEDACKGFLNYILRENGELRVEN